MKKVLSILVSLLFSIFLLIIGTGINVVKCNHSGKYKIQFTIVEIGKDFSCNSQHGCMEKNYYQFAPEKKPDFKKINIELPSLEKFYTPIFEVFSFKTVIKKFVDKKSAQLYLNFDFNKLYSVFRI